MSEKLREEIKIESPEGGYNPEDQENFEGQRVLVIGGPDAHGISMAVASAKYLEKRGAQVEIYSGSPVIREGKGATHPGAMYTKTVPKLPVEEYDRVVITDIPLDANNLKKSENRLIELTVRLDRSRERRGLPKIAKPVFFLDHHSTTKFEESWVSSPDEQDIPPKNVESHGVVVKLVPKAEQCRLGHELSQIARLGAISDRDPSVLPITDDELLLSRGLDAAVRPDYADPRPSLQENANEDDEKKFKEELSAWEKRAQRRLEEAIRRLNSEDWDYFRKEAERVPKQEIPIASGFGDIIIVDTEGLTGKGVLKLMEAAIENHGPENSPYAIAVLRKSEDKKMNRGVSDLVTIVRYWKSENYPSVEDILMQRLGEDFIEKYKIHGAENAKAMMLPPDERKTAEVVAKLIEAFAGKEMPDFSDVKSVVICGDPNSGKSVYGSILNEALTNFGVKSSLLDLDKAAPTPKWYLEAENSYNKAAIAFSKGRLSQEKLAEAKEKYDEAKERRNALKRPWTPELAEEARLELAQANSKDEIDFVIGDIGGGLRIKDETGKIIKIIRLTAENAKILESTDAALIVCNTEIFPEGPSEWRRLLETGIDPETGVRIKRDKPIEILGVYESTLDGSIQKVATMQGEVGIATNLDRMKADKKYNPTVLATAMFISKAVEKRKQDKDKWFFERENLHVLAERARNPYTQELIALTQEYAKKLEALLPKGCAIELDGSLMSNTSLRGHNDIDLRILLPKEFSTEEKIKKISRAVRERVPFQKVRSVGSGSGQFAVMHQSKLKHENIDGQIEIEISVRPAEGYIGYAKFQNSLPVELLDEYVVFKDKTKDSKTEYKKIKEQFYAMTRWLYAEGYWDESGKVVGKPESLERARELFWGNTIADVISKPTPEV